MRLQDSFDSILNLLFPKHCLFCKAKSDWYICKDCLKTIKPYKGNRCRICSTPIAATQKPVVCPICLSKKRYFNKGFSLFNYEEEQIKKLIEFIKFNDYPQLAAILFEFSGKIKSLDIFSNADFLIPVPMYKKDIRKRGYNQSAVIAKTLSKITKIPVHYDCLNKIKQTEKQVGLNYEKRTKNLSKAFEVSKKCLNKRYTVVLVDDVFTTGSTLNECAKTLLRKGIKSNFFTLATTPFKA